MKAAVLTFDRKQQTDRQTGRKEGSGFFLSSHAPFPPSLESTGLMLLVLISCSKGRNDEHLKASPVCGCF